MGREMNVTFRGMYTLALKPDENRAFVLMPRNDKPRVANGNERYTIPPYVSYVAIPRSAAPDPPDPPPNFYCALPLAHGQIFDTARIRASASLPRMEAVNRFERLESLLPEPPKVEYAVYFTNEYEIVIPALQAAGGTLSFDANPVDPIAKPNPGESSVFWLPQVDEPGGVMAEPFSNGAVSPNATAYAEINTGTMRPRGLTPEHRWRFLHGDDDFVRPIAQEILITAEAEEMSEIVLRPLGPGTEKVIRFSTAGEPLIVVGCEPLDDILGLSPAQSCAEPAYDFELQYQLTSQPAGRVPVPICVESNPDHRSPPATLCGPPRVITG